MYTWLVLVGAIAAEVSGTACHVGVAYAIWAGLGTALVAVVGVLVFGEAVTLARLLSLCLIVMGVVGLQLTGSVH